jgi:hypothetical protein
VLLGTVYCVSPCIAPKRPICPLSRSELPPNSRQTPVEPGLGRYMTMPGIVAHHNVLVNRKGLPEIRTLKGRVLCTRLGSLPLITSQYSIESSALMIFHGHWDWGLSPAPPLLVVPSLSLVVPLSSLYLTSPSRLRLTLFPCAERMR